MAQGYDDYGHSRSEDIPKLFGSCYSNVILLLAVIHCRNYQRRSGKHENSTRGHARCARSVQ